MSSVPQAIVTGVVAAERRGSSPVMSPVSSPDSLLLDAWRRAEATAATFAPAAPVPEWTPAQGGAIPFSLAAVDRVLRDHAQVQLSRAEARAEAASAVSVDARSRTAELDEQLECEREANARLREENIRLKAKLREEAHKGAALSRALREAHASASTLRNERDHWQDGYTRATEARDTAVRACLALREMLRDAPGYEDGAAATLLRAQLLAANEQLHAHGVAAPERHSDADGLAMRVTALEREVGLGRGR